MKQLMKRHWPWLKKVLSGVYLALVAYLVFRLAQNLEWSEVMKSLKALPAATLLIAALLAVASHVVYSSFDLLGRHLTEHKISVGRTMLITFVSYTGNLNFGSLVGAVGLRQRLYSRFGLPLSQVVRITATSMATNWLGYSLLAAVLLISPVYAQLAAQSLPAPSLARALGCVLLLAVVGYLALAAFKPGHRWKVGRFNIRIPTARLAMTQVLISSVNWTLISAIIYVLLEQRIGFEQVMFALLVAAVAGVITHVPAGLGVIEATFVLLLGDQVSREALLGVLLAYRAMYYLLPLIPAALIWVLMESHAGQEDQPASPRTV